MLSVVFRVVFRAFSLIFIGVMKLFFICLGLCFAGIVFLSIRLALGPLDVTFLKTFIDTEDFQKKLSLTIEVDHIFLKYNGVYDPIALMVEGITLFEDNNQVPCFSVPKVIIHADYGALLKGDLKIKSLCCLAPELSLSLKNKNPVLLQEDKEISDTLAISLLRAFSGNEKLSSERGVAKFEEMLKHLEEISIEKGSLRLLQEEGETVLNAKINLTLTHQSISAPLTFKMSLANVTLWLPNLDKRIFPISEINVLGSFNGRTETLEFMIPSFDWQGTEVKAKGEGKISERGSEISLDFESALLPLDQFSTVWPEKLAESTRSWILENLSKGNIDRIFIHLKGEIPSFQRQEKSSFFKVTELEGGFHINKIDVRYIEGLPLATEVFGVAKFDADTFNIEIVQGYLEGIEVPKGFIHFYDLAQDNEMAEIKLTATGDLQKILEVIDKKPLEYPTQLGIQPSEFQGDAEVNLLLKFPLLRHLTLDEVTVSTKSFLKNVSYTHFFEQRKNEQVVRRNLKIEKGSFDLEVDKIKLLLTGNGYIKGFKTDISWVENFKEQAAFSRKLSLKGDYPLTFFEDFGLFLNNFVTGDLGLNLVMLEKEDHFLKIDVTGDMTGVEIKIPELNIHKKINEPGEISFVGNLSLSKNLKKNIWTFSNVKLDGPSISLKGCIELEADTQEIIKIDLSSLKTPRNNILLLIQRTPQNLYQIKIRGKEFDAAWFFEEKGGSPIEKSFDFNLECVIGQVWLSKNEVIKSVTLDLRRWNNRIEHLISRGKFKTEGSFSVSYSQIKDTLGHQFRLYTSNAGEFLRAIDLYDHMEGGLLRVTGERSSSAESFLEGQAFLDDFRLVKTSVLGKILSLASMDWLADKIKEKKGILFRNASLEFKVNDQQLKILHGLAESSSTGITLKGDIDRLKKTLNLEGTIIPAYMFNSLIGQIPILGEILSGGKNKGFLAATYRVQGSTNAPTVHVNPLSILAPGFLRELF